MAETERLSVSSEIFIINATAQSIDVYINFLPQPSISDPKPLALSPTKDEFNAAVFVAKDDFATPYGVYTFSVRTKGDPGSAVLGEASIDMQRGRSYTGVFHELEPGAFRFSIYENDLSDGALARLTVIHAARAPEISWEIRPNGEDPRIPPDVRAGTLRRGEWQIARNITDNDYVIDFTVGGELVARNPDLDLARAKNFVVILFGDPPPASDAQRLLRPMVYQELEFDAGPAEASEVTPPAPPLSASDRNAPVTFRCEPLSIWETNAATAAVSASDPDGMVVDLSLAGVVPKVDGVQLVGASFRPSIAIGEPASASLAIGSDVPHGVYSVSIAANRGSHAHQARCELTLTVRPITVARLREVTARHGQSGDIDAERVDALDGLLAGAQRDLEAGDRVAACESLKDVLTLIGSHKGKAVSDRAHDHLERETKALRRDLQCG